MIYWIFGIVIGIFILNIFTAFILVYLLLMISNKQDVTDKNIDSILYYCIKTCIGTKIICKTKLNTDLDEFCKEYANQYDSIISKENDKKESSND